jgi:hypothetical protein
VIAEDVVSHAAPTSLQALKCTCGATSSLHASLPCRPPKRLLLCAVRCRALPTCLQVSKQLVEEEPVDSPPASAAGSAAGGARAVGGARVAASAAAAAAGPLMFAATLESLLHHNGEAVRVVGCCLCMLSECHLNHSGISTYHDHTISRCVCGVPIPLCMARWAAQAAVFVRCLSRHFPGCSCNRSRG